MISYEDRRDEAMRMDRHTRAAVGWGIAAMALWAFVGVRFAPYSLWSIFATIPIGLAASCFGYFWSTKWRDQFTEWRFHREAKP
jgi:hypothetical protein